MKIGIIKEGKTPPDKRVPLSPKQCSWIIENYPAIKLFVQKSSIRKFKDQDYLNEGIKLVDNVEDCDVLIGVKEVPIEQLISDKKYLFFSHTFKKQPYNRKLLQAVIEKNIQLIDWETITNSKGQRLIAFGRFAGIVGCFNGLLGYGLKNKSYTLKRAHLCEDRLEMEKELIKLELPENFKLVITGGGRVAGGAIEVLEKTNIKKVSSKDFLNKTFNYPVYTQLEVNDYVKRDDGQPFIKSEFYKNPANHSSSFMAFAEKACLYVACHYWDNRSPFIFSREDIRNPKWNIEMVADVSCDIDGPVASTLRPSTIQLPFYGYDPNSEKEVDFYNKNSVGVMAVDNLPCELPKDASEEFGNMFISHVLEPLTGNDPEDIIYRASETLNGKLTPHFEYLEDYLKGKD
ncbi:MAG: NAD(P)-dependent oxidoreductase [Flavobacteriales bacterium]|nr:NAD(P)-dependent oxidoreductase [Flavobacteriales bacterium]